MILDDLVRSGGAEWLDSKTKAACLVLWKSLAEWADTMYAWATAQGLKDSVVTTEELAAGPGVAGTELEGLHREVLLRAVKVLEGQGRAK